MVKYGKKFRKIQLPEWKGKYFDYKKFKQFIKKNYPENLFPIQENEKDNNVLNSLDEKIKKFTEDLDQEIKRVYIFFIAKEKKLYKDINKYLHQKDDYEEFNLNEYLSQFNLLLELSVYNFNLSVYTYYNLKAVLKILKKFDKKIIGEKNKKNHIFFDYIQTKIRVNSRFEHSHFGILFSEFQFRNFLLRNFPFLNLFIFYNFFKIFYFIP